MTTPENAAAVLRKFHCDGVHQPINSDVQHAEALNKLNNQLRKYIRELPAYLGNAYNEDARLGGWYPVPLEHILLQIHTARELGFQPSGLKDKIERQSSIAELREAARSAKVKLILSVRPNSVAVICNFLEPSGEVCVQCI